MEAGWSKPRKIFHFDTLQDNSKETEQQFFSAKKGVIEKAVTDFLVGDQTNLSSIVPLSRALQSLLIRNGYSVVFQTLMQIFQFTYSQLLQQASKQTNILLYILAYYISKKEHYKTLFTILNNYLAPHSQNDRATIEEKAYGILCKEIVKNSRFGQIGKEFNSIVQHFRQTKEHKELLAVQVQLNILASLGIYRHFDLQFLDNSKHYFVQKSHGITKNEKIFDIIDEALKRQTIINKILKPSEDTVGYLQKQFIEEYYPFLIGLMGPLIEENKLQKLKLLWNFASRLGNNERIILETQLKEIIKKIKIFLGKDENISKILLFRDNLNSVITSCFASSRTLQNALYNTIEEVLLTNEKRFNEALGDKIFLDKEKESDEIIQQLFKLIPNKQKFVKELQVRFFQWIIYGAPENVLYQEGIVHMMKKECGSALCKKIDRMVFDVWREGKMVYYHDPSGKFECRLLSINDWPKFIFSNIVLPDKMKEIIDEFETQLKKSPEHALKELQWVSQLGSIEMSINGVASCFSETEAALIFILDKSFRPMNAQQLSQVLQGKLEDVSQILTILFKNNILEFNEHNHTYDINDINTLRYSTLKKVKHSVQEIKQNEIKDNSIIIDAAIVKILKRKKILPKTELSLMLVESMMKIKLKVEEINQSIERLEKRQFLEIDKSKGILRYRE